VTPLVRRVRQEAAQAILARLPLRERPLEPVEHGVQRDPEPSDLRARVHRLDAVREVTARDRAGRVPDPVERQETDPHDRPREEAEHEQHAADDEQLQQQQPVQRGVHVPQRRRDHGDAAAEAIRLRIHPVARRVAVLAVDGERRAERDVGRQRRIGRDVLPVREHLRVVHIPIGVAVLDIGPWRQPAPRPAAAPGRGRCPAAARPGVAHAERARGGRRGCRDLVVEPVEQERALAEVGDAAEQQQPGRRDREHGHEQPCP
jgi:hypothetical protein